MAALGRVADLGQEAKLGEGAELGQKAEGRALESILTAQVTEAWIRVGGGHGPGENTDTGNLPEALGLPTLVSSSLSL